MPMIELDEGLQRQCLDDIRQAAAYLRDRMDELLKNVEEDSSRINGHGEVQDMGLRIDLACARYGLLRRLARGAGEGRPGA